MPVASFADHHLGKGVVVAKDSPNFIGNHIALYGVVQILKQVESGAFTIEEVDAITGPSTRTAEERDVQNPRPGRHRHPRSRRSQPVRASSR